MTPNSAISAQRHSPEAVGVATRSANDIFLVREKKKHER